MTEEIPKRPKDDYGFGINHPTVKPEEKEDSSALILTHPFKRFGADEQEISEMLEEDEQYDDVYYVGQSHGRVPTMVDNISPLDAENRQSRLPPGFEEGFYEEGLYEKSWGELDEFHAAKMLKNYDKIGVGGASRDSCVKNTFDSLDEMRLGSERYAPTEVFIDEEFSYDESDRIRKVV